MRFQVVRDPRARPAAYRKLIRAAVGDRTVTSGVLAIVAADDKPAGGNARCPAPYARLRVSPPGNSGHVTISAWLPGAVSYLPSCTSANGSPTAGTSTITTFSSLPH